MSINICQIVNVIVCLRKHFKPTAMKNQQRNYLKYHKKSGKGFLFMVKLAREIGVSLALVLILMFTITLNMQSQTIFENKQHKFGTSGYLRTGMGASEGGKTQAHFQMPGAQNKYSLGNQADTYGELEFDYTYFLDTARTKSFDAIWMTSIYETFGTENQMSYNKTEQLYGRLNNFLGKGEMIWFGKRFYDRRALHLMDRQWLNPGQRGWGFGMENLTQNGTDEDIKWGVWTFQEKHDDVSYINGDTSKLRAFTADVRWVHKPISENWDFNLSLNYTYRAPNSVLEYDGKHGFAALAWFDYEKKYITNTAGFLLRQGSSIPLHHWTGMSEKENPGNDNLILNDLNKAYFFEFNNNFLYDDFERYALNVILTTVIRDYGTDPYLYDASNPSNRNYLPGKGSMLYWLSAGASGMYYFNDYMKLNLEYTHEYVHNEQVDATGHLNKITFTPELSLKKGFYSRPVIRPFVNYAFWSDDLVGHIGTTPQGAPFGNKNAGMTYGVQFEIWW